MSEIPQPSKFRESLEKRHVIETPWPRHIPDRCPKCHTSLKRRVNLFHTRSKTAERLHGFAPWLSVIVLVIILVFMSLPSSGGFNGGQGSPMAVCAMIVGPSILLTILANCIPKVFKLLCHRCKFSKEFSTKVADDDRNLQCK